MKMSRRNRKELAKKIAKDIKRAIDNNRFKINGKFYLLSPDINRRPQKILEELREKGYLSEYEALKKVLLETRTNRPALKKNARPKKPLSLANYLF